MYRSPKNHREAERRVAALDALEALVTSVIPCKFSGGDLSSRYATIGDNGGTWGVKIRIADHAQTTNQPRNEADVTFLVGNRYTKDQVWRKIINAIHRNA